MKKGTSQGKGAKWKGEKGEEAAKRWDVMDRVGPATYGEVGLY
jgi:hypothetical protein